MLNLLECSFFRMTSARLYKIFTQMLGKLMSKKSRQYFRIGKQDVILSLSLIFQLLLILNLNLRRVLTFLLYPLLLRVLLSIIWIFLGE